MAYPVLSTANNQFVKFNSTVAVSTSGAVTTIGTANNTNDGDTLLIFVVYADAVVNSAQVTSITDSQGNTYTQLISTAGPSFEGLAVNPETELWSANQPSIGLTAGTDTVTVNLASSLFLNFSGLALPGAVTIDAIGANHTAAGTSLSASTGVLSQPFELIIAKWAWATPGPTSPVGPSGGPTTQVFSTHNASAPWNLGFYEGVTVTTSVSSSFTWSNSIAAHVFALSFVYPPPLFGGGSFAGGSTGVVYSDTTAEANVFAGSGTWSIVAGSLPTGLSISSSTGLVSGTPTGNLGSTFTVSVVDGNGNASSQPFSILINGHGSSAGEGLIQLVNANAGQFSAFDTRGKAIGTPQFTLEAARRKFIDHHRVRNLKRRRG